MTPIPRREQFRAVVQGHTFSLRVLPDVRPTAFSLFFANVMIARPEAHLAIDAGAGGGVLAIALARLGVEQVVGIECSARACEIFAHNVRANKVSSQVRIVHADIADYSAASGAAQLVVANPPTIPLTVPDLPAYLEGGGRDGMEFLTVLVRQSALWLQDAGSLQMVISSLVDPARFRSLITAGGFSAKEVAGIIIPLRQFYHRVYERDVLRSLAQFGRVLGDDANPSFVASEIVTMHDCTRGSHAGEIAVTS